MNRTVRALAAAALLGGFVPAARSEVDLIDGRTPWRACLVVGGNVVRDAGGLKLFQRRSSGAFDPAVAEPEKSGFSPMPPADWPKADFDDRCWARHLQDDLSDFLGDFGTPVHEWIWPALLCLRTGFGIADPAKATDLKVTITGLGGGVVYVNGREVGRGFMPAGPLAALTPAEDYPKEAYVAEDGVTALPVPKMPAQPETKWLDRYKRRVRAFTVNVPPQVLVKGRNVLAIAIHRAAASGPLPKNGGWSHLGFHRVTLTGAGGVIPYAEALKSTRVWSAGAEEQITESPAQQSLVRRSMFKTLVWTRGMPVKGVQFGNPFDPVLPIRMAAPRNGACSGQAVLSDPAGLKGVTAALGPMKGPQGVAIPPAAVKIRYAVQHADVHYCDALMPAPPDGAKTAPVWLIVEAPKDQAAGWYTGALSLGANGKTFSVPVQLLVTGYTLPPARQFAADVGVAHSPDTTAAHYKVEPWSDAHFRLMEPSLAMMGQLGNDVLQAPVVTRNQFNWRLPLVRFVKAGDALRPDFTLFNKYLDLYVKHCAPPKVISVYIWDRAFGKEMASSYEGRQIAQLDVDRTPVAKQPLKVQVVDPKTGATTEADAPQLSDPDAESFYKPLLDGLKGLVEKRGWPASCVVLGLGGDLRPSKNIGERVRRWAPYARWNLLSHFTGDPGSFFYKGPNNEPLKSGKLIAVGDLEVGLKEHPYWGCLFVFAPVKTLEQRLAQPAEFIDLPTLRWHWQDYSPPLIFRMLALQYGSMGRIGLDFWLKDRDAARNTSYFTASSSLTVPGPDGALPTVRFQMVREGVQDMELRWSIVRAYAKLPDAQRKPYRDLLDDVVSRVAWGRDYLSQHELSYDWPAYAARVQAAAAELAGVKTEATWDRPPAP
jgi:hypothetical protein